MVLYIKQILDYAVMFLVRKTHPTIFFPDVECFWWAVPTLQRLSLSFVLFLAILFFVFFLSVLLARPAVRQPYNQPDNVILAGVILAGVILVETGTYSGRHAPRLKLARKSLSGNPDWTRHIDTR
ncbi:hypothetical protein [Candidatus Scalindua japonica]|uniref:hypothetical protein n=1 Tax=Candidatus Scalindua japonica TaxID=1284222 RepID=UPI0010550BB4|nr:hypothetical protein [Candidatus Scalindua japonica]